MGREAGDRATSTPVPGDVRPSRPRKMNRVLCTILGLVATGCCRLGDPGGPGGDATGSPATTARPTAAEQSSAPEPAAPAAPEPVSTSVPCGAKAPAPWPRNNPDLGPWGEDRRTAPDFGYVQERRAPKMPDAGAYLARTPSRTVQQMDNALLICHVEIYTRDGQTPALYRYKLGKPDASRPWCGSDWDFFAAPDVLLKFRLRGEHPIALYGPEDHWGFFISVPRVRLARGDLLEVKLWDRDSTGDSDGAGEKGADYIGYASTTLSGKWPVVLRGPYFTMRCNAMSSAEAESASKRWLAPLDAKLRRLEALAPDPKKWDFGDPPSSLDRGEFSFGEGNFRYVAGFLGWDHPAIVERRAKVRRILEVDWPRKKGEAAKALAKRAAAHGKAVALGGKSGSLRVNGVTCEEPICTLAVEVTGAAVLPSAPEWGVQMASIDAEGTFRPASLVPAEGAPPEPGKPSSHRIELGSSALVLWIKSPAGVHAVKVRDPD